jgi:hypothetical protein
MTLIGMVGTFIGIVGVITGFSINYKNYKRTQDKDVKIETTQDAEMKFKIDYISKGVDDIRFEMRTTKGDVEVLKTTVARIDESTKSAHHRIDRLEKEGD